MYHKLFKNSRAIMLVINVDNYYIVDANNAACSYFGYSEEEITKLQITDLNILYNEELITDTEKIVQKEKKHISFCVQMPQGEKRYLEAFGSFTEIEGKNLVLFILHDISEEKRIKQELDIQKTYFRQLFETSPEGIIVVDNNDRIVMANKAFNKLFKYSLQEVLGCHINDLIAPEGFYDEATNLSNKVIAGQVIKKETVRRCKDGCLKNVSILGYPIFHNNDQIGIYGIYKDITERKRNEKKIKNLAYKDSLTQIYNREVFMNRIKRKIDEDENDKEFCIIFIDLDGFKSINDNLGHSAGDELLKLAADRIKNSVREKGIVARMGGDEFTILLTKYDYVRDVVEVVKSIINEFKKPFCIQKCEIYITISLGLAKYPEHGKDADELIKNADIAMYKAKEKTSNSYELYNTKLNEKIKEEFLIANLLRNALANDELEIYYQPIYNTEKAKIVGAEALLRWNNKELGSIPPNKFIPIAEKKGLISKIGKWVLKNACRQTKKWHDSGYTEMFISVNISVKQLERENFVDIVKQTLKETGLEARYLELEITESVSMKDTDSRINTLQNLDKIGIRLSMDDFGTGYSSLGKLNELAISKLKIDKSFIDIIDEKYEDVNLVKAVILIAKSLDLNVVAEGVETYNQLHFLKNEKCDMIQGYYYSPPVSREEFEKILES